MPGILLGDVFPNFEAETTIGKIKFHDFLGDSFRGLEALDLFRRSHLLLKLPVIIQNFAALQASLISPLVLSWGVLFSHPRDYTPVCTTELGQAAKLSDEFKERDVKMIALSVDSVEDHRGWTKDIMAYNQEDPGCPFPFPIIADDKRELAVKLGMLDPDERDKDGVPLTARCVFVIGPDKKMKLSILYPATTGRNFNELLRVIDSLQLTAKNRVATPVDWKPGDRVMVLPNVPEAEASTLFPAGVYTKELPSGKKYLRYTPQP